jgi:hypothetical protein
MVARRSTLGISLSLAFLAAVGCGRAPPVALLPADYPARFVEVRDCRSSVEHGLSHIVVKVDATVADRYNAGPYPFDPGTLVVKEEFADADCTTLVGISLMSKQAAGFDPRFGDWHWQGLDAARAVREDGPLPRCATCHTAAACRLRDFVCADP